MLTAPITTLHFHSRVLALLSNHMYELESHPEQSIAPPMVPSLSPVDTHLLPGEMLSQIVGVISPWIDLCSPDPVVYNISYQVLKLEVAFAAFCGISNLILPSPNLRYAHARGAGIMQYSHAIQEALSIGTLVSFSVTFPTAIMSQESSDEVESGLSGLTRECYLGKEDGVQTDTSVTDDIYATWDAWNLIRSICKYNARLFVGKIGIANSLLFSCLLRSKSFAPAVRGYCRRWRAHLSQ